MQLDKIKQTLRKVQALIENMEDDGQTSKMERDLLLRYLRDMYDQVLHSEEAAVFPKVDEQEVLPVMESGWEKTPPVAPDDDDQITYYAEQPPQVRSGSEVDGPRERVVPKASINTFENPIQYFPTETEVTHKVMSEVEPPVAKVETGGALNELFQVRTDNDIAGNLQLTRISAIESAMGINQRIMVINELFGGDNREFNDTLGQLNGLETFEQASEFLRSGPASAHDWGSDTRSTQAKAFIQLVRRRFV